MNIAHLCTGDKGTIGYSLSSFFIYYNWSVEYLVAGTRFLSSELGLVEMLFMLQAQRLMFLLSHRTVLSGGACFIG